MADVLFPQGATSVIGLGHGRIANTGHPGPSEHHQTNYTQKRALRAVHHPESGQGTPFDGKSAYHVRPSVPLYVAYSKTVASAEIDEAAVGPGRGTVLALRNADSLKRGETMPRGPRRRGRARFLTASKGLLFTHSVVLSDLTLRIVRTKSGSTERRPVHGRLVRARGG